MSLIIVVNGEVSRVFVQINEGKIVDFIIKITKRRV